MAEIEHTSRNMQADRGVVSTDHSIIYDIVLDDLRRARACV